MASDQRRPTVKTEVLLFDGFAKAFEKSANNQLLCKKYGVLALCTVAVPAVSFPRLLALVRPKLSQMVMSGWVDAVPMAA